MRSNGANLVLVDTELSECGLPSWFVSRYVWNTLDSKTRIEIRGGGSRRFTLTTTRKRKRPKKRGQDKLDKEDEGEGDDKDKFASHMTCHNIVYQNSTSVKLVVYQKLEW